MKIELVQFSNNFSARFRKKCVMEGNIYDFIYIYAKHGIIFRAVLISASLILLHDFVAKAIDFANLFR